MFIVCTYIYITLPPLLKLLKSKLGCCYISFLSLRGLYPQLLIRTGFDPSEDIVIFAVIIVAVVRGDGIVGATAVNLFKRWCVGRGDSVLRPLDPLLTPLAS